MQGTFKERKVTLICSILGNRMVGSISGFSSKQREPWLHADKLSYMSDLEITALWMTQVIV